MEISPQWSATTKFLVLLAILAVVAFFLIRFQGVIAPVILAVILAYLLNPIVTALVKYSRLPRTLAVLLVYAVLILLVLGLLSGAGLLIQQQVSGLLSTALAFINSIPAWINSLSSKPLEIGPFTLDLSKTDATSLQNALLPTARDSIGQITNWMTGAASEAATTVAWAGFVFIVSFFLIQDMSALPKGLLQIVPESFLHDAQRLLQEMAPIWDAFLRAQILLSLIMGAVIGAVTALLGLRYAFIIGLMAFLAEFIPIIGANVIGILIFFVAYFQPSNWFGLSPIVYAIVVVAIAGSMQQIKGYTIVPRIMGDRLRIHPVIMIVGALIGFTLLGIPGLLLAGPIIATTRLFGNYVRAKLLDLPPWPEEKERSAGLPIGRPVICRPAKASDRQDVLELTARTWDGHDYIPEVWSEWLADRVGILAAAELGGQVVGIGKLTRLAAGEWWIEGLRVHPEYQGMKIGSQLFEYLLAEWRKRGGGSIRLATSSERVEVHHLCDRLGFRHVDTFLVMAAAPTRRGENAFAAIAEAEAAAAFARCQQSASAQDGSGLINTGWRWSRLTEDRVRELARSRRAWWWKDRTGVLMLHELGP